MEAERGHLERDGHPPNARTRTKRVAANVPTLLEFSSPIPGQQWTAMITAERSAISFRTQILLLASLHLGLDRNVKLRVVLLHVTRSVLRTEFLNHGRHLFRVCDRGGRKFCLFASRVDPNRRVLEHILVPLG